MEYIIEATKKLRQQMIDEFSRKDREYKVVDKLMKQARKDKQL